MTAFSSDIFQSLQHFWRKTVRRKLDLWKREKRTNEWLRALPVFESGQSTESKTLLIVRLDDIGDYFLFRPALETIKKSAAFQGWKIRLMGNQVWYPVFHSLDRDFVDEFIPFDKKEWFSNPSFREKGCTQLHQNQPELVWLASRTRHFFLEDVLATAFPDAQIITCGNSYSEYPLRAEAGLINHQNRKNILPLMDYSHEFLFNQSFTKALCGETFRSIQLNFENMEPPFGRTRPYLVLFPGASANSKKWPAKFYAELATRLFLKMKYPVCLAGGPGDVQVAEKIASLVPETVEIVNLTGKTDLLQLGRLIQDAAMLISNDTGAAHLAALAGVRTLVICNGNKKGRFFPYPPEFSNVQALFPEREIPAFFEDRFPVSDIHPDTVFSKALEMLS